MNYTNIYNNLMQRAQSRTISSGYEIHHILPKSLGGSNTKSNLVKLTLREHFLAHRLLTKMFDGQARKKMYFAYYRLSNRHHIQTGRFYEKSKLQAKTYLSEIHSGKTISETHKQAIREKCKGMVGKKHTCTALAVMSKKKLGNNNANVGINIVDSSSQKPTFSVASISDLCKKFDLTRGQAEHYIYKQRPFNGMLFVRQKIITKS